MNIKKINTFWKLFPLLFILITVLIFTVKYGVPIEFLLTIGTLIACIIAYFAGYKWKDMEEAFIKKIVDTWLGVLIFILIGIVVGSWVYSGTVPMLIYYGIKLIHPSFIPLMAFVITSFLSIFTGTSWGSASTAGVAFIGIAQATNTPLPLVAGAVISGAYLGPFAAHAIEAAIKEGVLTKAFAERYHAIAPLDTTRMSHYLEDCHNQEYDLVKCVEGCEEDATALYRILKAIIERAGKLTAINLTAAVLQSGEGADPRLPVVINADGTTFYKTAFLEFYTRLYLDSILEKKHGRYYEMVRIDNSPTLGAAIAGLAI